MLLTLSPAESRYAPRYSDPTNAQMYGALKISSHCTVADEQYAFDALVGFFVKLCNTARLDGEVSAVRLPPFSALKGAAGK
jgi:hypothetical protein